MEKENIQGYLLEKEQLKYEIISYFIIGAGCFSDFSIVKKASD